MTDRFEEMSRFTDAMTNFREVRKGLDESVLDEIDMAAIKAFDHYAELYSKYVIAIILDLMTEGLMDSVGKVKE